MKPKKIQLQELKVKSFITVTPSETQKVMGGIETRMTGCRLSCMYDCDTLYYSIDLPCYTDPCNPGGGTGIGCSNTTCPTQKICI